MATSREARGPGKADTPEADLRKGKWTIEEENYANKIITLFNQGMLPVVVGTTLRTYLSDKLRCDPMRITKKYAGASCIGKQVFQLADNYYEAFQENERELQRLEALFLARITGKGSGMASKRNGSSDALAAHQSIYETTNPERAVGTPRAPQSATKRTPKEPKKMTPRTSSQNRTPTLHLGMGCESPGKYRRNAAGESFFTGEAQDYYQDDEDEDDYGYAYDPDSGDEPITMQSTGAAPFALFPPHGALSKVENEVAAAGGWNTSSMGRRVLSAPNLSELGLSSWKETDYHPMPADSLKEMFSQPIQKDGGLPGKGATNKQQRAVTAALGVGSHAASLLPDHVYSALGNESGRYARTTAGGRGNQAARARATRKAYQEHLSGSAVSAADDSESVLFTNGNGGYGAGYNSFQAGKRSFSAMALVDFEKLAGDDLAAGDLFLEFLHKVGGRSGTTPSPGTTITSVVKNEDVGKSAVPAADLVPSSSVAAFAPKQVNDTSIPFTNGADICSNSASSFNNNANPMKMAESLCSTENSSNILSETQGLSGFAHETNTQHEPMILG